MLECVHDQCRWLAIVARSASRSRSRGGIVMIDATDMSTPVTRGELRAELAEFEVRLEQKFEQKFEQVEIRLEQKLEQKLAHLATKAELEIWGGALLERMLEGIKDSEQRLFAEIARHTRASYEAIPPQ